MKKAFRFLIYFFAFATVLFFGYYSIVWLIQLFILSSFFAILMTVTLHIFSKKKSSETNFLRKKTISYMVSLFAFFGFFVVFFVGFLAYNHFSPAKLSDITLSNGSQTVVFMQMSHIANEEFYTEKNRKLREYANSGAVILVEWVRPWTPENTEKFYEKLSFRLTNTLYDRVADFLGLASQEHETLFRGIDPEFLVSVDVSVDDLVGFMGTGEVIVPSLSEGEIVDLEKQIEFIETTANDRTKSLYRMAVLSILNSMIRTSDTSMELDMFPREIYQAIVTERDNAVVEYIRGNPDKTVVVPYGALHFDGIFRSLVASDAKWKILGVENFAPYKF